MDERFPVKKSKELLQKYLDDFLCGQEYDMETANVWTKTMCQDVKNIVKSRVLDELGTDFKLMIQCFLFEKMNQSVRVGSRQVWTPSQDSVFSVNFCSQYICAVIIVQAVKMLT